MGIREPFVSLLLTLTLLSTTVFPLHAQEMSAEKQTRLYKKSRRQPLQPVRETYGRKGPDLPFATPLMLKPPVEGFDFDTNAALTGSLLIPPDPMVAVGQDHVLNVGNVSIEWRDKADPTTGLVQQSLQTFFSSLPGPSTPVLPIEKLGTLTFDPKCIYDQYADRFIVIAPEQWDLSDGDPSNESRILLAVSKTSDPNAGWWFHVIYSNLVIGTSLVWADYPGLAVDDKAVYITANMFEFTAYPSAFGSRLWIVDKTPFYNGPDQSAVVTVHDPYASAGTPITTQPAHMWGPPPTGLGTYLVSYSGFSAGPYQFVQVVGVSDPLGASGGPNFAQQFINVGTIDSNPQSSALPDAAQADTTATIEVNDRRVLNAVWRDNALYMSATVVPPSGPDAGQTTAHWWEINTTAGIGGLTVTQQANVGAEDLGAGTSTFFPAIMVDCLGNVAVGFSASNSSIYCGAYYAAQQITDPLGTMQDTQPLALGTDWYVRTFGQARNRWGDYSGLALCPVDEAVFWVYNEYACTRGTPTSPPFEDGRWCTKLGSFRLKATASAVPPTPAVASARLEQNFPNPFNPLTSIRFTLHSAGSVKLEVFDTRGRLVTTLIDGPRPAGENHARWPGTNSDGRQVGSGVYYYRLTAGALQQTRKMVLLK